MRIRRPKKHSQPRAFTKDRLVANPPLKISHYLFLQGQIGRFFSELGNSLQRRGHIVRRINFNSGDGLFWQLPDDVDFTGRFEAWPGFLSERLNAWGITDLILFGDCRPLHKTAIELVRARGIQVHVFEEGYLRPEFVTLEQGGVNGHSLLPRNAEAYLQAASFLPDWRPGISIPTSFRRRASEDVLYNLSSVMSSWRFPHYRSHRPWHPFVEYAVGLRRFPLKVLTRKQTERRIQAIVNGRQSYFLFPLQLDADSQIRFHAPEGGMPAAIRTAIQSFARHASDDTLLVLTEHPLDYGPVDLEKLVTRLAAEMGLSQRLVFLRGGSPAALINAARGMVTVNSTIGITAMASNIPTITLGTAIYDMAGLTFQEGIDAFWKNPLPPQARIFDAFRRVLAARTQINGGYYSTEGIARAVAGARVRLEQAAAARITADIEPLINVHWVGSVDQAVWSPSQPETAPIAMQA